jgi:hypothetical protein
MGPTNLAMSATDPPATAGPVEVEEPPLDVAEVGEVVGVVVLEELLQALKIGALARTAPPAPSNLSIWRRDTTGDE